MATPLLEESGPALDHRIARLLEGRSAPPEVPRYSTDEGAADTVTARLAKQGLASTFEQDEDKWYCVIWVDGAGEGTKERIATGSGATRPLAVCRAVLNLPLRGSGRALRLRRSSRGWAGDLAAAGERKGAPSEALPETAELGGDSARAQ